MSSAPDILTLVLRSLAFFLGLAIVTVAGADEPAGPELRAEELQHFPPVKAEDALGTFQVRDGFHLELAAHEPEVMDPVALSFDERGRVFVVEMRDYSERRPERLGRVRRLEDRDGDGYFETSTVFLDDLPWPTAVACWDGGVFIGATPELLYAKDTDGDGHADIKEVIFTGFASDAAPYATNKLNVQAMMNSLQWGLDCRIHGSASLSGGHVHMEQSEFTRRWRDRGLRQRPRPAGAREADDPGRVWDLRGRDFWFDPLTLEFQPETGGGQHGMTFDDTGRKFVCSNSDHLQLVRFEEPIAPHNDSRPLPAARASIAADGPAAEVFRISPEEPWRIVRTRWRVTGLVTGPVEGGGRASGYFTGASGVTIYRGDAYGPDFEGDVFVADCGSNLVHRKKLTARGCELVGARPADEQRREFIASRDTWFRPVQFANAPDGCLWILDMYREIIEHPWSLPPNLKRFLDLNAGSDRGRLYRVVHDPTVPRRVVDLGAASAAALVNVLGHANGWHRDSASRLLCERRDPSAVPLLHEVLRNSTSPLARIHALYVLSALGDLNLGDLEKALADPAAPVRRHGIRLCELRFSGRELPPSLSARAIDRAEGDPLVRLQWALALASVSLPQRLDFLIQLLRSADGRDGESLIVDAVLTAVGGDASQVFLRVTDSLDRAPSPEVLSELAEMVGVQNRPDDAQSLVLRIARLPVNGATLRIAVGLAEGLQRAGNRLERIDPTHAFDSLRALAHQIIRKSASDGAANSNRPEVVVALRFLASAQGAEADEDLLAVLAPGQAPEVQRVALQGLFRDLQPSTVAEVLSHWQALAVEVRQLSLDLLLRGAQGTTRVLQALEEHRIAPGDLTAMQLSMLRRDADPEVQRRLIDLLGPPPASRGDAVAAALPALNLAGDPRRGMTVYQEQCMPCHRLAGQGHSLGPDLESVRSQPKVKLLLAIVDPNREVAPSFLATTVETTDGESFSGLLISETSGGTTLKMASGIEGRIPRSRIRSSKPEGRSLMPEGFERTLTPQQFADLLACLSEGPPNP